MRRTKQAARWAFPLACFGLAVYLFPHPDSWAAAVILLVVGVITLLDAAGVWR